MKKLMKLAAFGILMGGLMSNTAFAGLLISDVAAPAPCTTEQSVGGLLISDFVGILLGDLVGGGDKDTCKPSDESLNGLLISD